MAVVIPYVLLVLAGPSPSPEQSRTIAASIADLGSPRFAVRELADLTLLKIGAVAKPSLRKAAKSKDPEVVGRAESLIRRIVDAEIASLRPLPYVDAWWYDPVAKYYRSAGPWPDHVAALREAGHSDWPYATYRQATEAVVRRRLAAGASPQALRPILAVMHYRDGVFLGKNNPEVVDWVAYLKATGRHSYHNKENE